MPDAITLVSNDGDAAAVRAELERRAVNLARVPDAVSTAETSELVVFRA